MGARAVTIAGTVVLAASAAGTGLVGSLWQLFLVYAVCLALGLAATGPVVATTVVSRWFVRRRATALSMPGAASRAGMSLLVPVVMWLILTVGWRAANGAGVTPRMNGEGLEGAGCHTGREWRIT